MSCPSALAPLTYVTQGQIRITRHARAVTPEAGLEALEAGIDARRGAILVSDYDYPGRYARWSLGFLAPPLEIAARGLEFTLTALNPRGEALLAMLAPVVAAIDCLSVGRQDAKSLQGRIHPAPVEDEAQRVRQPSVFTLLRALRDALSAPEEPHLGLYGAFGFDLVHQFEPLESYRPRPDDQRDLVLYLPDRLLVVDHQKGEAFWYSYSFEGVAQTTLGHATAGLDGGAERIDPAGRRLVPNSPGDLPEGGYAAIVRQALPHFLAGDMFEAVPSHSFRRACSALPSQLFRTLRAINPSPYGFVMNLGGEYLIGASPEMFVRVSGDRVETCPISGTIRRGADALQDAENIRTLLNSAKDEAELTMCTDVDRNDKSRVCRPESIRVIGRRQIEMYSHLIHTVDHVEGRLAPGYDALDAFLSHAWAVTVTGAPKKAALAFIDSVEVSPRRWYGGAVGALLFDGGINTGLTLRTIRLQDQIAEIRAGATLLHDSEPEAEEAETRIKAAALMQTLAVAAGEAPPPGMRPRPAAGSAGLGRRVLFVDCEDSFVHTLAGYFRAEGAEVAVRRAALARTLLEGAAAGAYDLVVFSPGPGTPQSFGVPLMVRRCAELGLPAFGVCLGLQGMVEAFGGRLGQLPRPWHGRGAEIRTEEASRLFVGLEGGFRAGRYHSLFAQELPACLRPTAWSADGVVMAVDHRDLPMAAVQFHPESILSAEGGAGQRIIANVLAGLAAAAPGRGQKHLC